MTDDEAVALAGKSMPVDPADVVKALEAAGWVKVGGRTDVYVRMSQADRFDGRYTVLFPLDRSAPEYSTLMVSALATLVLRAEVGRQAQRVLDVLQENRGVSGAAA